MKQYTQIDLAHAFCVAAHSGCGQVRKYTGTPYHEHPMEVARLVASFGGSTDQVVAALLHDVVEDTEITIELVESMFGKEVARMVDGLTDKSKPEDGNRAVRKAIDLANTAKQCPMTKTVKICDLIHNTSDIMEHDRGFAKMYILEKERLLEVLTEGDSEAWHAAMKIVVEAKVKLGLN